MSCIAYNLFKEKNLVNYKHAWHWQRALREFLHQNSSKNIINSNDVTHTHKVNDHIHTIQPHRLILLEHPSIYTLGRGSTTDNITNKNNNIETVRVERGGEVTWHGPGQLVVYPIFDLGQLPLKKDLRWLVSSLEEVVIQTLANTYNIKGGRVDINSGVWVDNNKICAVGITASRWITMHGLALNINPNMSSYNHIIPCGISDPKYGVTSIDNVLKDKGVKDMQWDTAHDGYSLLIDNFLKSFGEIFELEIVQSSSPIEELDIILDVTGDKFRTEEPTALDLI